LRHPNLIGIQEVGEYEGLPFYALEYMDGGSLDKWVGDRPQPLRQAAKLVETLARAIHVAHQCGIIHRDLKPGNIRLEVRAEQSTPGASPTHPGVNPQPTTIPKITAFGLARRFNEIDGLTQTGAILGTPSYTAPEQALGKSRNVGPEADIYALGAILDKLLTGRPPFQGDTSWNTIHLLLAGDVVAPRPLQLSVPQDLQRRGCSAKRDFTGRCQTTRTDTNS
jgi:serine/threonine protein kinase